MSVRLNAVRRALLDAPAEAVVECLADALAKEYAITDVDLLLVDYRLRALTPLRGGAPVTRPGDPAWRCFDHQVAVPAGSAGHLPVTVRGERLGVLRCAPYPDDPDARGELAEAATALAHELQSAGTGTDRYAMAARTRRLTLAAELQWALLPGRSRTRPAFGLAGQLEPAYAVRGDSFDWAEHGGRLFVGVLGGMGDGVSAALLSSLAIQALRNARRGGLDLADQAALADQAVFAQYRGAAHVEALLLEIDLTTGAAWLVDTGSPRLLVVRGGVVTEPPRERHFPLGMFEGSEYTAQRLELRPDDRLYLLTDGVPETAGPGGRYGDAALHRFVRRAAALAPLQAVRSLIGDLAVFLGDEDPADDAVAVCVDWHGTGA